MSPKRDIFCGCLTLFFYYIGVLKALKHCFQILLLWTYSLDPVA